jgi:predicted dithiol-disulfide oxidoreductase (DUF899 family)
MTDAPLHYIRYPAEGDDYRRARNELLYAELELRRQQQRISDQRQALPLGGEVPTDYVFDEWDPASGSVRQTRMSELFNGEKDDLLVYSFMFKPDGAGTALQVPCPLCTSIIDGIDGAVPHLSQRLNVAVVAKAPIERFNAHARARGWRHSRLLSSATNDYNRDYHAERSDDDQFAMATVFTRRDGAIRHFWSSEEWFVAPEPGQNPRHVDFMWPLWGVLDRSHAGRGSGWMPSLVYSRDRPLSGDAA